MGKGGGGRASIFEDVPPVEFMYLAAFARIPGERYRKRETSNIVQFQN